jgi:hypothetical protein
MAWKRVIHRLYVTVVYGVLCFFICMMLVEETTRRQVGPLKEHIMAMMMRLQEKGGEPGASGSKVRLSSPPRSFFGSFDEGGVTMAGRGGDGEIVP